jgi:hypothetical protein
MSFVLYRVSCPDVKAMESVPADVASPAILPAARDTAQNAVDTPAGEMPSISIKQA